MFHLSVGWGERVRWQGETHAYLWSLQCQSEPSSPRQLVGHALPVPAVSSTDLCDTAFLGSRLCQSALTLPDMQGDPDTVLQTGWLSERAGEDLGSWGEWWGISSFLRPKPETLMRLKKDWEIYTKHNGTWVNDMIFNFICGHSFTTKYQKNQIHTYNDLNMHILCFFFPYLN